MTSSTSAIQRNNQPSFYARVSTERQADDHTIESQVAALRKRIMEDGLTFNEERGFIDDGASGTTLMRAGLERLRDTAYAGGVQRLYVHSPDRLARRYAYQVLLVDELRQCGTEIVFLNRTIGVSPEEDLFLQMQGMFAEYERAKILERSRRGKRYAAQKGEVSVLSNAPYGYRYVPKRDKAAAAFEVIPERAAIVHQIFEWVGRDRLSISEVCRRLKEQGTPSPTGKPGWSRSGIWNLLKNTAFCGRATFGKTQIGERRPQLRPQRGSPKIPRRAGSIYRTNVDQHIVIPVPAIVEEGLFAAVQEQLDANQRSCREHCRGARYLLQGLVVCGCCHYAYYGQTAKNSAKSGKVHRHEYYRCPGTDAARFGGQRICRNRVVHAPEIDAAVWQDVTELLRNPRILRQEYQRRLERPNDDAPQEKALRRQEQSARGAVNRLIDAYTEGTLKKSEFEPRLKKARERLTRLGDELTQLAARDTERTRIRRALACIDEFTSHVSNGLDQADWKTRRELIRLLIDSVSIEIDHVRIVYRINLPLFLQRTQSNRNSAHRIGILQFCSRRQGARTQRKEMETGARTQRRCHDPQLRDRTWDFRT